MALPFYDGSKNLKGKLFVSKEMKKRMLFHFKMLKAALKEKQTSGQLNCDTFEINFKYKDQTHYLFPQFIERRYGQKEYVREFNLNSAKTFIGWRPYLVRPINVFKDKLSWKKAIQQAGFDLPPYSLEANNNLNPILIKRNFSCFSENIRGPFNPSEAYSQNLIEGEFFEQFIYGKIVKIWFWKEQAICAEVQKMPHVTGNGRDTIQELLHFYHKPAEREVCLENVQEVLRYFYCSLDTVLDKNETQLVDFRYGSAFANPGDITEVLFSAKNFELQPLLDRLGIVLWSMFAPAEISDYLAYTVDAIWDRDDRLWILEVNTNPFIHPWLYPSMINTICTAPLNIGV